MQHNIQSGGTKKLANQNKKLVNKIKNELTRKLLTAIQQSNNKTNTIETYINTVIVDCFYDNKMAIRISNSKQIEPLQIFSILIYVLSNLISNHEQAKCNRINNKYKIDIIKIYRYYRFRIILAYNNIANSTKQIINNTNNERISLNDTVIPFYTYKECRVQHNHTFCNSKGLIPAPPPRLTKTPVPTKTPTKIPAKTPTKTPAKTPTKIPAKTPTKTPAKTPTKTSAKTPTKTPAKTPTKTSARNSAKTPTKTSAKTRLILQSDLLKHFANKHLNNHITSSKRKSVSKKKTTLSTPRQKIVNRRYKISPESESESESESTSARPTAIHTIRPTARPTIRPRNTQQYKFKNSNILRRATLVANRIDKTPKSVTNCNKWL
jgi:hypothetical protein